MCLANTTKGIVSRQTFCYLQARCGSRAPSTGWKRNSQVFAMQGQRAATLQSGVLQWFSKQRFYQPTCEADILHNYQVQFTRRVQVWCKMVFKSTLWSFCLCWLETLVFRSLPVSSDKAAHMQCVPEWSPPTHTHTHTRVFVHGDCLKCVPLQVSASTCK